MKDLSIRWLHMVLGAVLLLGACLEVAHTGAFAAGAFLLLAVLVVAAAIHLARGENPGALLVYAAAVLVVLAHRGGRGAVAGETAD